MKKVLFVLAFVAVYGVSMSMSTDKVVTVDDAQITIVADMDDNNNVTPEGTEEKAKKTKKAKAKAKASADAKGEGCGETKAKGDGCDGKSEAKKDCGSACDGKK